MSVISDKQINDYLNRFHINHFHRGYTYLMTAIRMQVDETIPRGQMQDLYRAVAEQYETKSKWVSTAIRQTLQKADVKMRNGEFIVTAMDELVFEAAANCE